MTTTGGRTKTSPADDGPTYFVPEDCDYGTCAPPGEAARLRAFFSRRDELDVIVNMLVRHHGFDPGRARAVVWGRPGLVERLFSQKGRPPKPHLVQAADVADEVLASVKEVRWDTVHREVVAPNEPREMRPFECNGEKAREPRDSENWQRAVRRIRARLRAVADALARVQGAAQDSDTPGSNLGRKGAGIVTAANTVLTAANHDRALQRSR